MDKTEIKVRYKADGEECLIVFPVRLKKEGELPKPSGRVDEVFCDIFREKKA